MNEEKHCGFVKSKGTYCNDDIEVGTLPLRTLEWRCHMKSFTPTCRVAFTLSLNVCWRRLYGPKGASETTVPLFRMVLLTGSSWEQHWLCSQDANSRKAIWRLHGHWDLGCQPGKLYPNTLCCIVPTNSSDTPVGGPLKGAGLAGRCRLCVTG